MHQRFKIIKVRYFISSVGLMFRHKFYRMCVGYGLENYCHSINSLCILEVKLNTVKEFRPINRGRLV